MIALIGGKVITIADGVLEGGTVLVEGAKIREVGMNIPIPADAEKVDVSGYWVTPGLIDAHTHISVMGEPHPADPADGNEMSDPVTPHLRAIDALNPRDPAIAESMKAGFTTCYTGPGSANVIGGTGISLKLKSGKTIDDIILPGSEHMKAALGENPKKVYGDAKKAPMTRMAIAALLREALYKAKDYGEEWENHKKDGSKPAPKRDFKLEPLLPVVQGRMKLRIHCHRSDDIYTAIRIAEEFGLDYAIEHCTEGYRIPEVLAEKKVPCVIGPLAMGLRKKEIWEANLDCAKILTEAGVDICFTEDASWDTKWLLMKIGLCIGRGLQEEAAFRAVTINPAKLLGLDARIGTLVAGKDADIAIFNGNPFLNTTLCKATMIDGKWEYKNIV